MSRLDNVKQGDHIALLNLTYQHSIHKSTADRCTATRVNVAGRAFLRRTGREVGGSKYYGPRIEAWDEVKHPQRIAEMAAGKERNVRIRYLREFRWGDLSDDQLAAAFEITTATEETKA